MRGDLGVMAKGSGDVVVYFMWRVMRHWWLSELAGVTAMHKGGIENVRYTYRVGSAFFITGHYKER